MPTGIEALKAKCTNFAALARELNITRGAIAQWKEVPAARVIDVEAATGIPRQVLRPDLFDGMISTPETERVQQ